MISARPPRLPFHRDGYCWNLVDIGGVVWLYDGVRLALSAPGVGIVATPVYMTQDQPKPRPLMITKQHLQGRRPYRVPSTALALHGLDSYHAYDCAMVYALVHRPI